MALPPLSQGEFLDKYELQESLDAGSFGTVWRAHHHGIGKAIALKVIERGSGNFAAKLQESHIGNQCEHPNLVKIHDADLHSHSSGTTLFLVASDFQKSGSVKKKLNSQGYLPLPEALRVMREVLDGLQFLHDKQILHNDIKPGNILVGSKGESKLGDYGISVIAQQGGYTPTYSYGPHAAPEALTLRGLDERTDVYQAGATLLRLVGGDNVLWNKINGLTEAQYIALVTSGKLVEDKDFLPFIPSGVRKVVKKAMAVDPAGRYSSALEMRHALERLSYPGYWDVTKNGEEFGVRNDIRYTYRVSPKKSGFCFEAFQERKGNNRRVGAFCKICSSMKEVSSLIVSFQKWVVSGK